MYLKKRNYESNKIICAQWKQSNIIQILMQLPWWATLSDEFLLFYELNSFSVSWIEIFLRKFLEQSFSHCFPIKNVKYSAKNESQ